MDFQVSRKDIDAFMQAVMVFSRAVGRNLRPTQDVVGGDWERIVYAKLVEMHGAENVMDLTRKQLPYDFLVHGLKVQSKSRQGRDKNSVTLYRHANSRYKATDVDFFAVRHRGIVYVFPFSVLVQQDGTVAAGFPCNPYSPWRDAWEVIGKDVDPFAVRPGRLFPGGA